MLKKVLITAAIIGFFHISLSGQGFYKDIFMSGGINLTSREYLPAARFLDLSIEFFASPDDTLRQNKLFIGSDDNLNGVLLYPDGQPRFRMIYVNGGSATSHGKSLDKEGRSRIYDFFKQGGSYVGTCAGAFLSSAGTENNPLLLREGYLNIWPGRTHTTGLRDSYTGMFIEENSPLLKYFDFGGDMYIDSVRHNGGCYAFKDQNYPDGTEVLLRYDYPDREMHEKVSTWAYKPSPFSGRVVNTGSHPEGVTSGERLDLMAAMLLYALDGTGEPVIKGELQNNEIREMIKSTGDNDPDFTKIGDKQYHHFEVSIPEDAKNIRVELKGAYGYDLNLYLKKGDFAFKPVADYKEIGLGSEKELQFDTLEEGIWCVSVECYTTVETRQTEWGVIYIGKTEVLNGVPYTIMVSWD